MSSAISVLVLGYLLLAVTADIQKFGNNILRNGTTIWKFSTVKEGNEYHIAFERHGSSISYRAMPTPSWAYYSADSYPDINVMPNGKLNLYYIVRLPTTQHYFVPVIGVATADALVEQNDIFSPQLGPLIVSDAETLSRPTLVQEQGNMNLYYYNSSSSSSSGTVPYDRHGNFNMVRLSDDGLGVRIVPPS